MTSQGLLYASSDVRETVALRRIVKGISITNGILLSVGRRGARGLVAESATTKRKKGWRQGLYESKD